MMSIHAQLWMLVSWPLSDFQALLFTPNLTLFQDLTCYERQHAQMGTHDCDFLNYVEVFLQRQLLA